MSVDLKRYIEANKKNYTDVYSQTMNKTYDSGWMSYILPRMEADCDSQRSKPYGLKDEKEAKAFWKTKLLRNCYVHILIAMMRMTKEEFDEIYTNRAKEKILKSIQVFQPIAKEMNIEAEDAETIDAFMEKFFS